MNWFERSAKRDAELARGVDADLVRDNRWRFKWAWATYALGFLLMALGGKIHVSDAWRLILFVPGAVLFALGFLLNQWAQHERWFLRRPEPEEPPSILKDDVE